MPPRRSALALRLAAIAAIAAVVLGAPAGASAKGIASLSLCGADGCHRVDPAAARAGLEADAPLVPAPRRRERFFSVRARARVAGRRVAEVWAIDWLPRARVYRGLGDGGRYLWTRPAPVLERALQRAARGLRPKPAAELGSLAGAQPRARVVETFAPADDARGRSSAPSIVLATGLAAAALLAAAAVAVAARARNRRRRSRGIPASVHDAG